MRITERKSFLQVFMHGPNVIRVRIEEIDYLRKMRDDIAFQRVPYMLSRRDRLDMPHSSPGFRQMVLNTGKCIEG
jgi:hypothetical protein